MTETDMTHTEARGLSGEELREIEARHSDNEKFHMMEYASSIHKDRAALLSHIRSLSARPTARREELDLEKASVSVAKMVDEWKNIGLNEHGISDLAKLIKRRLRRFVSTDARPTARGEENTRHKPAYWTHDRIHEDGGHLYYFAPTDRALPPYKKQITVEAILDIAADGTLAGVELIGSRMPPPPTDTRPTPEEIEE